MEALLQLGGVSHEFINVGEITLHTVLAGPADGPLVILLHGFPEFWYGWRSQILPLAQAGYRIAVPDQRGYNLSEKPHDLSAYRIDRLAGDVLGLMRALGREQATLVGHDWGGVVAWTTAVLFPQHVARLVVLNAPYHGVVSRMIARHPAQLCMSAYILFFQIPLFAEAVLRNNHWELLARTLRRTSRPGVFPQALIEQYRQAWWRRGAMTGMLNWYRALLRRPLPLPQRPRITAPTLILWGAKDFALSRPMAQLSAALCEHVRLVFFEDASHWLQHEQAEEVNRLIIEFLGGNQESEGGLYIIKNRISS
jgi:pimeloyl-ACP methyl ester carboxylesterase